MKFNKKAYTDNPVDRAQLKLNIRPHLTNHAVRDKLRPMQEMHSTDFNRGVGPDRDDVTRDVLQILRHVEAHHKAVAGQQVQPRAVATAFDLGVLGNIYVCRLRLVTHLGSSNKVT